MNTSGGISRFYQNHMDVLGDESPSTRHLTLITAAPSICPVSDIPIEGQRFSVNALVCLFRHIVFTP